MAKRKASAKAKAKSAKTGSQMPLTFSASPPIPNVLESKNTSPKRDSSPATPLTTYCISEDFQGEALDSPESLAVGLADILDAEPASKKTKNDNDVPSLRSLLSGHSVMQPITGHLLGWCSNPEGGEFPSHVRTSEEQAAEIILRRFDLDLDYGNARGISRVRRLRTKTVTLCALRREVVMKGLSN